MRLIKEFPELNAITVVKKHIPIRACQMVLPFEVDTLEGRMHGKANDYLMEGIKKELYICDKDIFEMTYEKVEAHKFKKLPDTFIDG